MYLIFHSVDYKAHREYNGIPPPPFPNPAIIKFQIGQPVEVTQKVTPEWWKVNLFIYLFVCWLDTGNTVLPYFNAIILEH